MRRLRLLVLSSDLPFPASFSQFFLHLFLACISRQGSGPAWEDRFLVSARPLTQDLCILVCTLSHIALSLYPVTTKITMITPPLPLPPLPPPFSLLPPPSPPNSEVNLFSFTPHRRPGRPLTVHFEYPFSIFTAEEN